jgi:hypothetical protein
MRRCFLRDPLHIVTIVIVAIVLLPDHLHALWTLPSGDDRYSLRWRWIKREFCAYPKTASEKGQSDFTPSRVVPHRGLRRWGAKSGQSSAVLGSAFSYYMIWHARNACSIGLRPVSLQLL